MGRQIRKGVLVTIMFLERIQITTLGLLLLLTIGSIPTGAQEKRLTVNLQEVSLDKVFELIQQQSGFFIFYNDTQVDLTRKLTIRGDDFTVPRLLSEALKGTGLHFRIIDRQIIILRDKRNPVSANVQFMPDLSPGEKTIEGRVTDENDGPLAGVSVYVKGTTIGVTTDLTGYYQFKVPVNAAIIVFSFVGMKTSEEVIAGRSRINAVLLPDNFGVEEIVVSALGIPRKEKSLTYATQTISGKKISGSRNFSFINNVSGKISGMEVSRSASGAGGSTKVLLRGNKSLNTSSEPLFVIDGIPMANNKGRQLGLFDGADQGDGLSQISQDDIESITVLKGANAAILYGSQGANGVVLINTQKGQEGIFKARLSSSFSLESVQEIPELQYRYGSLGGASESWSYTPGDYPDNFVKDFFRTGRTYTNSLSISGGNQRTTSYFSASQTSSDGVMPKNHYQKINFMFKQLTKIWEGRANLGSTIIMTNEKVKNRNLSGYYLNPLTGLYFFPRDRDFSDYANNYQVFNAERNMYLQNWFVEDHFQSNPYWIINNEPKDDEIKRLIASVKAGLTINDKLKLEFRGNYDYAAKTFEERHKAGSNVTNVHKNGRWVYTKVTDELIYGDALLLYNDRFGKIGLEGILGSSYQKATYGHGISVDTNTDGLLYPNEFYFQNIDSDVLVNSVLASRLIKEAVFGNLQFSYDDKIFLDFSGRNDWSSSLYGTGNDSYFYPSAGIAGIVSELVSLPQLVTFAKLRTSYSIVSNEVPFNSIKPQHTITRAGVDFNTIKSFDNLKPEKIKSFEAGADWQFFDNRMGVDFTYYHTTSLDQFIELPAVSGSGYSSYYINAGKVVNSGTELSLFVSPWRARNFEWMATLNYAGNRNRIVRLHPDLKEPVVLSRNEGYQLVIQEGGSYGDMKVYKFERDDSGRILLEENGTIPKSENPEYIGNSNPRRSIGLNNHFSYKNFELEFLINGKFGGKVISQTEAMLDGYGVSERSAEARDRGMVAINAVLPDGTPVSGVDPKLYYTTVGNREGIKEVYTYSRSNIRLAQAMLSWKLKVDKVWMKEVQFSLTGQNLFFLYCKAPFDPEVTLNTLIRDQAIDSFSVPPYRSIGLSIKIQF